MTGTVTLDMAFALAGTLRQQAGKTISAAAALQDDRSFAQYLSQQSSRLDSKPAAASVTEGRPAASGTASTAAAQQSSVQDSDPAQLEQTAQALAAAEAAAQKGEPADEAEMAEVLISPEATAILQHLWGTPQSALLLAEGQAALTEDAPQMVTLAQDEALSLLTELQQMAEAPDVDPEKLEALLNRIAQRAGDAPLDKVLVFPPETEQQATPVLKILQTMEKRSETAYQPKPALAAGAAEKTVELPVVFLEPRAQAESDLDQRPGVETKLLFNPTGQESVAVGPAEPDSGLNLVAGEKLPEVPAEDPRRFIEQLVKTLELTNKAGQNEVRIQLKPEFLGKMMVALTLEEGVLTARFITESHQVKSMLEANMAALRQNLENSGIKVEKTEVEVEVNTGGAFERDLGQHQRNETAWTEQALARTAYDLIRWDEEETWLEDRYLLASEAEDALPPQENVFAAGRMNLVV